MQKRKTKDSVYYAFIDSQNLNLGVRAMGWRLDFRKFRAYLGSKYNVSKAFIFLGEIKGNEHLYNSLRKYGYEVVLKPTVDFEGKVKGNVDAELVLHTVIEKDNYDKAIIVSGDGDFRCLIDYLDSIGKLLRIIVPNRKYSSLLRPYNNRILPANLIRKSVERKRAKISDRSKP